MLPMILQQLGNVQPQNQMNQIKQMFNMVRNASNPSEMLSKIASRNPSVDQVMQMIKTSNDPKKMFYELAKQKGVNPDDILNMLR